MDALKIYLLLSLAACFGFFWGVLLTGVKNRERLETAELEIKQSYVSKLQEKEDAIEELQYVVTILKEQLAHNRYWNNNVE